jgi:hypothetical protein
MAEHEGGGGGEGVLRELLAVFSFGVDTEELKKGETALGEFFEKVKGIAEAVAGVFAFEAIEHFVEANVHAMTAIEHTATQLGLSTDKVQAFEFAAKSMGMEGESLVNMMGRLQVAQQAAAGGSKAQAGAFAALHVQLKDTSGGMKTADELFLDVAEGIADMEDPSKRAAEAVKLFGRQGRQLLPFLAEGRKGVEELLEQYKELGGGYSEDVIDKSKDFEKESAKLGLTLTGLKNIILRALLPVVTKIVEGFTAAARWFANLAKQSNLVQVALGGLAAVATYFAIQMAIAAAPILLTAAAIGALLLIFEDVYTFLTGGQSEIGEIIDKIFGEGYQTTVLEGIKITYRAIRDAVKETWEVLKKLPGFGESLAGEGALVPGERGTADAYLPSGKLAPGKVHFDEKDVQQALGGGWLSKLATGVTGTGAELFNPLAALERTAIDQALPQNSVVNVKVDVPNGLNAKEVGEHVGKAVGEVIKQRHKAAAATIQRKAGT